MTLTVDAYRNKMRSTMLTSGQEVESVAPHFETRIGKRKWMERNKRARSTSPVTSTTASPARRPGSAPTSAAVRDAQEVEP